MKTYILTSKNVVEVISEALALELFPGIKKWERECKAGSVWYYSPKYMEQKSDSVKTEELQK